MGKILHLKVCHFYSCYNVNSTKNEGNNFPVFENHDLIHQSCSSDWSMSEVPTYVSVVSLSSDSLIKTKYQPIS